MGTSVAIEVLVDETVPVTIVTADVRGVAPQEMVVTCDSSHGDSIEKVCPLQCRRYSLLRLGHACRVFWSTLLRKVQNTMVKYFHCGLHRGKVEVIVVVSAHIAHIGKCMGTATTS